MILTGLFFLLLGGIIFSSGTQNDEQKCNQTAVNQSEVETSCLTERGEKYRGSISVTWSGKKCQSWSVQTPHQHSYTPEKYPCGDLKENYCRNPGNDTNTWCYTTNSKTRWEYCSVPICEHTDHHCSEQDLLRSLNLTSKKDQLTMGRPLKHHKKPVDVFLKVGIYAILDVTEIAQTLILHIWTHIGWSNHHIKWNQSEFCNISKVNIPAASLWKPDIIVAEQIERSKNPPSPYVTIWSHGAVSWLNEEVMVTNCKIRIYRFPFDTQSCNITFKSQSYDDAQLKIVDRDEHDKINQTQIQNQKHEDPQTQLEWLFQKMEVNKGTTENVKKQTTLVFTISMKRWSTLYIVNFLLPIFFFLCLDLASFLISDTGGEKLGFKITVLLAVTVMQLLLNEILPGSSEKIPLIVIFCIGIFSLMLLSVLETILVMNLIDRDD
ncbi:5-hydroxytryptamine receptor 3A-like, partial [Kryptolebias marmoratus]|uniref:5-hydroxytryptamine receptor 3A-like n=1 Tax=Kryptolebias marmoratus TaxID=37003 RepID=UPI0007F94385